MTTSYIIDFNHLLYSLEIREERARANVTRHFQHWLRGVKANGILIHQNTWMPKKEDLNKSEEMSVISELFQIFAEEYGVLDISGDQLMKKKVDCLIGSSNSRLKRFGDEVENIMHYFNSETEKEREKNLLVETFHNNSAVDFENFLKKITRYAKTIEIYDPIWGRVQMRESKFPYSFLYHAKIISENSLWRDDVEFKIYTDMSTDHGQKKLQPQEVPAGEASSIDFHARTAETIIDAIETTNKRHSFQNLDVLGRMELYIWENQYTVHDRFLVVDNHVYSYGRGFDVFKFEKDKPRNMAWSLLDLNVYYVGPRLKIGNLLDGMRGTAVLKYTNGSHV